MGKGVAPVGGDIHEDAPLFAQPGSPAVHLSQKEIQACKKAARKILSKCQNNIADTIGKLDHLEEGIVVRDEVRKALEAHKIPQLEPEELQLFFKCCDRGNKGYLSTNKFIDKLHSLAAESEVEVIIRRMARTIVHTDINLKSEMLRYDLQNEGCLSKMNFKKCMKQQSISVTDQELAKIIKEMGNPDESIDIKKFCAEI